ncbi:MAG: VWA domain-containing protein [Nitrospira sp.]|nr:VWA domain-containing protein [Nitrospira sp.]
MLAFDVPWAFAALPLPLLVWRLLPPYREVSHAVRIPFFEEAAQAAGLKPAPGAVVIQSNWAQKILAPIAWGLIVTAAADPQWIEPPLERIESARDLMLAIDLSQSMEARDFVDAGGRRVDRLRAVKQVVDDFIRRRKGDRIGLIVFGQAAFPQAPLTMDHESVRLLLNEVRIGMAGPQTSIGDAIGVAIKMTEHSKSKERLLVLLTDGNDTASNLPPHKAAEIAKQRGITIHTIGIGDPRAQGEQRVDLNALRSIAAATGGRSFRGEDRHGLEGIYRTIDDTTPEKVTRSIYRPKRALFYYPLGAAIALLLGYHLVMMFLTWGQIPNHKHQVPTWMKISNHKKQVRI